MEKWTDKNVKRLAYWVCKAVIDPNVSNEIIARNMADPETKFFPSRNAVIGKRTRAGDANLVSIILADPELAKQFDQDKLHRVARGQSFFKNRGGVRGPQKKPKKPKKLLVFKKPKTTYDPKTRTLREKTKPGNFTHNKTFEGAGLPQSKEKTLLEINTVAECLWPLGDPREPTFRYCAADKEQGKPYCPFHEGIAYAPR